MTSYTVLLHPDKNGSYTVTVPDLPGVTTQGETFDEACRMAAYAIHKAIEAMRANGRSVPPPSALVVQIPHE